VPAGTILAAKKSFNASDFDRDNATGLQVVNVSSDAYTGAFYVFNGYSSWNHNDGGYVTLYSASGEEVDKTAYRQDTMNNDFTYGRHPDGYDTNTDGDWGLGSATKGESNIR
jgi:hypothetical protein